MRDRLLNWAADVAWRRPMIVLAVALALAALCGAYAALELRMNANTDDLVDPDKPFMRAYLALIDEFGDPEHIYAVVVNEGDVDRTKAAVDALTEKLQEIEGLPDVFSGVSPDEQLRIATRAMPIEDLRDLAGAAWGFTVLLQAQTAGDVARGANAMLQQLISRGLGMQRAEQEDLAGGAVFLLKIIASARAAEDESGIAALIDPPFEYFTSDTGRFYFIEIVPAKDYGTLAVIEEPLRRVRAAIAETQAAFPGIEIGLTGKPVLQADEMATTNRDMQRASIIGFILVALAFAIVIGGVLRPALAAVAFACAAAWTYGAATLFVGQLNLLSIVFMLVLIGIGFDFAVHVITRYKEHLAAGDSQEAALRAGVLTAGRANITSAVTSSAVFFTALVTGFLGLRELGLIAGVGLLLCLAAMTFVLPALLVLFDRRRARKVEAQSNWIQSERRPGVLRWELQHPKLVLSGLAILTIAMVIAAMLWGHRGAWPRFEENLLELQSPGLKSVEWERRILEDAASGSWFGAVIADDLEEVEAIVKRARGKETIGATRSVFDVIAMPTAERATLRRQVRPLLLADLDPPSGTDLSADDLQDSAQRLATIARGAEQDAPEEAQELRSLSESLSAMVEDLKGNAEAAELRQRANERVTHARDAISTIVSGDRLALDDALPDALRARYVSPAGGRYLVMMHPRENVWELGPMRRFIADMRAVDPRVTGSTIAHFESMQDMQRAFAIMAALSFFVVAALVWLDFRSLRDTALTMLPLAVGVLWTIEIMALCDIALNLANFFAVPILFGVGVDSAVHIMHRYREAPPNDPTRVHLGATRRAVILTALTTMIGFGCLVIAQHRGLRSLGMVMALGSAACLVASMIVLPSLLAWMERQKPPNGRG